jgi:hypothetical protein
MQQVDRTKIIVMYTILSLVTVFFIFGCASKSQYTSSTKSFDNNITKDQLLHAVKRVFTITDKDAFIIDSYRNDLNITKPKAVHKLYTMDIQNDNFDFKVDDNQSEPKIKGTISISRTYGIEEENRDYIDEDSFTYELFWERVEYLLGLKKEWKMCNYVVSDGFMCDLVDLDNSWFVDKNRIDLNTTSSDRNNTVEMIDLNTIYKKRKPTEIEKEKSEDISIQQNSDNKTDTQKSSNKKVKDDGEVKSFQVTEIENNLDTNATLKPKKKTNYLDEKVPQEINLDNNSTNG